MSALLLVAALNLAVPEEFNTQPEPEPVPQVRLFINTEEDTGPQPGHTGWGISNAHTSSFKGMVLNSVNLPETK